MFSIIIGKKKTLILFGIANIAFEMGCVFCNAYIPDISNSNNMGKISGYGYAFGYLGGLLALVFGLFTIALPETPMFGISLVDGENYRAMNILVALWLFIFSLPTFLWIDKDNRKKKLNSNLIKDSFSVSNLNSLSSLSPHIKPKMTKIEKVIESAIFIKASWRYVDRIIIVRSILSS